ncbi:unnamed protein product, partial (mitochondrion) [Musa textilis]
MRIRIDETPFPLPFWYELHFPFPDAEPTNKEFPETAYALYLVDSTLGFLSCYLLTFALPMLSWQFS